MIQSINATPVYNNGENLVVKKLTGFVIFIDCGIKDADEIFNLLKKMDRRYFTEPPKKPKNMDSHYWIDTKVNGGADWILYRRGDVEVLRGTWPEDSHCEDPLPPERHEEIVDPWEVIDTRIKDALGFVPDYDVY